MSILKTEIGTAIPNFLDSEVGLVTKTAQIPQSMGQTDGDRKTVFAGTVFPANTSAATGIVFQDVDVTDGAHGFWDRMTAVVHLKLDQPRRTRQDCDAQVPCLNRVPTVVAKDVGKRVRGHRNPLPIGRDADGEGLPLLFVNSAEDATGSCTGNLGFP